MRGPNGHRNLMRRLAQDRARVFQAMKSDAERRQREAFVYTVQPGGRDIQVNTQVNHKEAA